MFLFFIVIYVNDVTITVMIRGKKTYLFFHLKFFKPLGITPKKINLNRDGSGRTAAFSEVEFNSHAEAVIALRKKNAFIGKFVIVTFKTEICKFLISKRLPVLIMVFNFKCVCLSRGGNESIFRQFTKFNIRKMEKIPHFY